MSIRIKSLLYTVILFLTSCQTATHSGNTTEDAGKTYKLKLDPQAGSAYHYDIINKNETNIEVDGKKIETSNKSEVGINYTVDKDSSGNILLTMSYDKISIHSKTGDQEINANADNGSTAINPMDKMLGLLKEAVIIVKLNTAGEVISINGYDELGDKITASFTAMASDDRAIAKRQWERMIGEGLIKKNMEQLFKLFPDSAVHINDTWKLTSREEGELPFNITSNYELKTINNDIALITASGTIKGLDHTPSPEHKYITAGLEGKQESEFEMEAQTGMLISSKIKAGITGKVQMMGREVPVTIESTVTMKGKKTR